MSTVSRGYGAEHRKTRDLWAPVVAAGLAYCCEVVCINPNGRWIRPGSDWHLAHTPDKQGYRGPAHARCNTSEAGRRGNGGRRSGGSWSPTRDWYA